MRASRRQQQACVWKAAADGTCACVAIAIVRSNRGHRPEWLPLVACSNAAGVSCIAADPRAPGRPWATGDRGSTAESPSHVARLFKLSYRCADWAWACPATRAARCAAADRSHRRTASARSVSIGSVMRASSNASEYHRNKPSPEPILPRATKHICLCKMLAAATTDPRRAALARVPLLANSDPKARSALCIRI